jgi:aminoglycoside/choline kinase family phosphotransferase
MNRSDALRSWLATHCGMSAARLEVASSDASFRRYFRVTDHDRTWIVMDAPPDREDCRPFVHVAGLLRGAGLHAPEVRIADLEQGFLLLEDLGPETYLDALAQRPADPLYRAALAALCRLQAIRPADPFPSYDHERLRQEIELFPTWYLERHLGRGLDAAGRAIWEGCSEALLRNCSAQAQVFVHRDFHSRNLMVCDDGPGILDFQDAVLGPITYDLVSLLRDAYVDFEEAQQIDWLVRWWELARTAGLPVPEDFGTLYRDFEWMGVQRQLKVLGIFARLNYRDHKPAYLASLPRVLGYLQSSCERYAELRPLSRLLAASHDTLRDGLSF